MESFKFPDWVNTLVNGAIAGSLLFGVVQISGLKERISVLEATLLGQLQIIEQKQRVVDVGQDGRILALEKRVDDVEAKLRMPLAKMGSASMAVPTWENAVSDPLSSVAVAMF